jgi:hypothetical protein
MNYIYGINPQTGVTEMGYNMMGHWIPRANTDYNYKMSLQQPPAPMQYTPNPSLGRAQQSYNETLAGLQNNPAFNQQAMFSGLSNPMMGMNQSSFGQPTQGSYGAGRFTGGLLGLPSNFNAPTTNT